MTFRLTLAVVAVATMIGLALALVTWPAPADAGGCKHNPRKCATPTATAEPTPSATATPTAEPTETPEPAATPPPEEPHDSCFDHPTDPCIELTPVPSATATPTATATPVAPPTVAPPVVLIPAAVHTPSTSPTPLPFVPGPPNTGSAGLRAAFDARVDAMPAPTWCVYVYFDESGQQRVAIMPCSPIFITKTHYK